MTFQLSYNPSSLVNCISELFLVIGLVGGGVEEGRLVGGGSVDEHIGHIYIYIYTGNIATKSNQEVTLVLS